MFSDTKGYCDYGDICMSSSLKHVTENEKAS